MCECKYNHEPACQEGQQLAAAIGAAEKEWQEAPLEVGTKRLERLHNQFTACLRAYFEHVKACSVNA